MMLFSNCSCAAHKNNFSHPSEVELGLVAFTSCGVELDIPEMAFVSRNSRTAVPAAYGIPVQRSISERDVSYPSEVEFEKA